MNVFTTMFLHIFLQHLFRILLHSVIIIMLWRNTFFKSDKVGDVAMHNVANLASSMSSDTMKIFKALTE